MVGTIRVASLVQELLFDFDAAPLAPQQILLCVKHLTLLMAHEWLFSFPRKFGRRRAQILG
jgi:hypothetical protein